MVLDMTLEVSGQILDTLGEQGHLDLRGSGIPFVKFVFLPHRCFSCVYHISSQTCSGFFSFSFFFFRGPNLAIEVYFFSVRARRLGAAVQKAGERGKRKPRLARRDSILLGRL
jgi:membrane protease subunit (stomatin/prohibitin family)